MVFSGTQLSFWARNAEGETLRAIKQNQHVALVYHSSAVPVLHFIGRDLPSSSIWIRSPASSVSAKTARFFATWCAADDPFSGKHFNQPGFILAQKIIRNESCWFDLGTAR